MRDRKPHLWCLYIPNEKRILKGLLFDEARAVISSLPEDQVDRWLVWQEDWPDWKKVSEVEGLAELLFRPLSVAPPPVPGTKTLAAVDAITGTLTMVTSPGEFRPPSDDDFVRLEALDPEGGGSVVDLRKSKRFQRRYEIALIQEGRYFKSHTIDISVGGMLLEDPIPEWISGYFKVRIKKPHLKQQVELAACIIEDAADKRRVAILALKNSKDEQDLEMWLAA